MEPRLWKVKGRHQNMFVCRWKCSGAEVIITVAMTEEVRGNGVQVEERLPTSECGSLAYSGPAEAPGLYLGALG